MEYVDVIKEITEKLTGNNKKDIKFLVRESEKWVNHRFSSEILRAVGRMIAERLPKEDMKKIEKSLNNMHQFTESILDEVEFKIRDGALGDAEKLIIKVLPHEELFADDAASSYFSFNSLIEKKYYQFKFKPSKEIRINPMINNKVFLLYAYILIEKKKYGNAMKILDRGLKLNPLDTKLLFEKGEIFKIKKDWTRFEDITNKCLEYAYSSIVLARAYRNLGYMFIEKGDYDGAICCYYISLSYEQSNMAQSQLYYITQVIKKPIDEKNYGPKYKEILTERGIQVGPNQDMIGIVITMAEEAFKEHQYGTSYYFYNISYDLTKNKDIYNKLKRLETIIKKL